MTTQHTCPLCGSSVTHEVAGDPMRAKRLVRRAAGLAPTHVDVVTLRLVDPDNDNGRKL